jgi:hypothetical protein
MKVYDHSLKDNTDFQKLWNYAVKLTLQNLNFSLSRGHLILAMSNASFSPLKIYVCRYSDCFSLKAVTYNAPAYVTFDKFAGMYWCVWSRHWKYIHEVH